MIPTSHDRTFIPYLLGIDVKFEKCLPDTLVQEGEYSNDAHDPGGMTMEGIIQKEYDLKRKQWRLPTQWVKKISKDEVRTIYYTDYLQPYCPQLPAGLDLEFFDLNVNGGQHRAVVTLQQALFIRDDGDFGPATQLAVEHCNVDRAIKGFCAHREAFYKSLTTFKYFGKDWIRRSEEIEKQAEGLEPK
jgi:lysozyme family protein